MRGTNQREANEGNTLTAKAGRMGGSGARKTRLAARRRPNTSRIAVAQARPRSVSSMSRPAQQQGNPKCFLQRAHLMTDGGLGYAQLIGCFREALVARDCFESPQGAERWERKRAFGTIHGNALYMSSAHALMGKFRSRRVSLRRYVATMKLYRFRHSPFARKVQTVLDLLRLPYDVVDVAYGERNELAELTNGYVYVPVLVEDEGEVIVDSREICRRLLLRPHAGWLVPSPLEGPIWAYADFADGVLEDITFRIGSPETRQQWPTASDRALYTMNKERKFGAGCIEQWLRDRDLLIARAQRLLAPSLSTLSRQPFLFGDTPTLADAALHGQSLMLQEANPELVGRLSPSLVQHAHRISEFIHLGRA